MVKLSAMEHIIKNAFLPIPWHKIWAMTFFSASYKDKGFHIL